MTHFKGLIGLGAALLLLPLSAAPDTTKPPAQGAPNPATRVQGDLVNLRVNTSYDSPGLPLLTLVEALKTYPKARRFRVSWSLLIFMDSMNSTALYDRRPHTLRLFSDGGGDVAGSYRDHVLYTNVRASAFAKIAAAHKSDSEDRSAWSWFGDLTGYGCRERDLGFREESPGRGARRQGRPQQQRQEAAMRKGSCSQSRQLCSPLFTVMVYNGERGSNHA